METRGGARDDPAEAGAWFLRQRRHKPGRPSRPSCDPLCQEAKPGFLRGSDVSEKKMPF